MSRIRSLKPEFFRSRSLAKCSIPARLTFAGLWCEADDTGNGIADTDILKGALWPKDASVTALVIEEHLAELVQTGHIALYEAGEERYYHVRSWVKHQPPSTLKKTAGKYPPPLGQEESGPGQDSLSDTSPVENTRSRKMSLGQVSGVRGLGCADESVDNSDLDVLRHIEASRSAVNPKGAQSGEAS